MNLLDGCGNGLFVGDSFPCKRWFLRNLSFQEFSCVIMYEEKINGSRYLIHERFFLSNSTRIDGGKNVINAPKN
jgi:hypothetical protein